MEIDRARANAARTYSQVLVDGSRRLIESSNRLVETAQALDAFHQQRIIATRDRAADVATRAGLDSSRWSDRLNRLCDEREAHAARVRSP